MCRDARLHLSALQRWEEEEKKGWRGGVKKERERDDIKQVDGVKEHGGEE